MNFKIIQRVLIPSFILVAAITPFNLTQATEQSATSEFPGRRVGGGSRGGCSANSPLIALMPESNLVKVTDEKPILHFSLPQSNQPLQLELIVRDSQGNVLANTPITVENSGRITGLSLADTIAEMEIDQNYQWYLSVICNQSNRSEDLVVYGWMSRVAESSADVEDRPQNLGQLVQDYQEVGLWNDAVATLVQAPSPHPADTSITELWDNLLEPEGLSQWIDASEIYGSISPQPQAISIQ